MRLIEVVPYDPCWQDLFEREAYLIRDILGEEVLDIHHIGSTSVSGLCAKPIIDILPVVRDVQRVDAYNNAFAAFGYTAMGEYGIPGRRFFKKGGDQRSHHVHIFDLSHSLDIKRHLAFRDYLRTHPQTAAQYGELKSGLAAKFPHDIDGYCDGKDAFIKQTEQIALDWYQG